jgi:hypothetical protein
MAECYYADSRKRKGLIAEDVRSKDLMPGSLIFTPRS